VEDGSGVSRLRNLSWETRFEKDDMTISLREQEGNGGLDGLSRLNHHFETQSNVRPMSVCIL